MTSNIRSAEISMAFTRWLQRYSPPAQIRDNQQAQQDEVDALLSVLMRSAPQSEAGTWVARVLDRLEYRMKTRAWPTKGELAEVCAELDTRPAPKGDIRDKGDRAGLSRDQLYILDTKVLPTARRWLSIPGLAHHGRKTHDYWGEK